MAAQSQAIFSEANPSIALPRSILAGLGWGLAMWWSYAVIEYALLSALPLFQSPQGVFNGAHWRLSGLLFDAYWFLGALSGAAAGTLVRNWNVRGPRSGRRDLHCGRLPGTFSLLVAIQVNLCLALPAGAFAMFTLALAFVMSVGILWVLRHPDSRILDFVDFNPFLLAFLLIGPTWFGTEALADTAVPTKVEVVVLVTGLLFGGNWLLRKAPRWTAGSHFLSGVGIMALIVLACGFRSGTNKAVAPYTRPSTSNPGRAPVIMIVLDTTRADHLSLSGYSRRTTPHLSEFAAGATTYTNVMAAGDLTLSTHATMFTGVYPSWHGARVYPYPGGPAPLDGRLPTLAGILSANGYASLAACSNSVYLSRQWGLGRGFDRFSVQRQVEVIQASRRFELRLGLRSLLGWTLRTPEFERLYRNAEEVNDQAISMISQPDARNRSFFLYVNYMDAHVPYLPEAPYDQMFTNGAPALSYARHREMVTRLYKANDISEEDRASLIAQYDGGIAYADFALSRLIKKLKSMDLYDRSMIIITSDHGESFGEHGVWFHGNSIHQNEVGVPLLIKYPGQTTASVVQTPASQVDLMPTILATLGYPIPGHVQGHSLPNLDAIENRQLIAESVSGRAFRWGSLKLIVSAAGKRELYDLGKDPNENHNMYSPLDPESKTMDEAYAQWLKTLPVTHRAVPQTDREELKHLRGLGYVQ
jgi:arylsulfatase A-like enzyme